MAEHKRLVIEITQAGKSHRFDAPEATGLLGHRVGVEYNRFCQDFPDECDDVQINVKTQPFPDSA